MSNFAPKRTDYDTGDSRWLRNALAASTRGASVTTASFKAADIDATGLVKSGAVVAGKGLLRDNLVIKAGEQHLVALVDGGDVDRRFLPAQLTIADEAGLKNVNFINGTAPVA